MIHVLPDRNTSMFGFVSSNNVLTRRSMESLLVAQARSFSCDLCYLHILHCSSSMLCACKLQSTFSMYLIASRSFYISQDYIVLLFASFALFPCNSSNSYISLCYLCSNVPLGLRCPCSNVLLSLCYSCSNVPFQVCFSNFLIVLSLVMVVGR